MSKYAADMSAKNGGSKYFAIIVEDTLQDLCKKSAAKANVSLTEWGAGVLAQAVRQAGFAYTPRAKAPGTVSVLQAELRAKEDRIAELEAKLAEKKDAPTPPAAKANAATGKVEEV